MIVDSTTQKIIISLKYASLAICFGVSLNLHAADLLELRDNRTESSCAKAIEDLCPRSAHTSADSAEQCLQSAQPNLPVECTRATDANERKKLLGINNPIRD